MKPVNRAERNGAFLWFLLFFLITIALVVMVIFFSIEVPFRESRQLRNRVVSLQTESETAASFHVVLKEAMAELNKFNQETESPQAVNQRVQYKIQRMENIIKEMSDPENSVYPLIVQNIAELNNAKLRLREVRRE